MVFEIYTVGFGDMIRLGLDLTAMLFNYMLASPLVAIAIIVGVGAVAVQSLARGKIEVMQLVMALALFLVMFVPRADVTVVDILGDENSSANGVVIEDVPLGLALAGAVTSAAATWMSEAYQTIFISDNQTGAQFTNQQFAFPLRMMMHLRDVEACDLGVNFCRNLQTYTRICYQPAMAANAFDQEDVYQNPERVFDAAAIQAMGAIEYLNEDGATGIRSCAEAGEDLEAYLDGVFEEGTKAHEHLSNYIRARMGDAPPEAGVENSIRVDSGVVRQVAESILGAAAEQRNITVTHIARQVHNAAQVGGFGAEASALWLNQTMERSRLISSVEASSMLRMLLIMMGLMQFLFIVMTPAIAIVALVKGGAGYKVYGGWILLAVWSSMFLVTVTVIDFWAQRAVQTRFTDLYAGSTEYSALSVPGLQGAYAIVADILQTAYKFLSAAPLVTLVMLTGSMFPLAMMARGFGGGAEASNLAGTQAVGDKAAMQMPSEHTSPDNLSGWAGVRSTTAGLSSANVTQSEALQSRFEATNELRETHEDATLSSFATATNEEFSNIRSGLEKGEGTQEWADSIQGTRRFIEAVTGDSTATDQYSDKDIETFAKHWQMGGSIGVSPPIPGNVFSIGGSASAGVRGESASTQESVESLSDRVNVQLNAAAESGSSVLEASRIAQQWTSQKAGTHSEGWKEVQQHADSYKQLTSEIDSLKKQVASSQGTSSSVALDATTVQQLEADLRDQGGVAGFLDSRANQYGEEIRNAIEEGGGLPDLSNPEVSDRNLSAALRLNQMASNEDLPSETRYAAADLLGAMFGELSGTSVDRSVEALQAESIAAPVDRTGVGGQHLSDGEQRTRAEGRIAGSEQAVDQLEKDKPSMDGPRERAWDGMVQEMFNEVRLEETQQMDQRLGEHQEHLSRYASDLVPGSMNLMAYRSFNSIDEALERAAGLDAQSGGGSEHQDFVHAMGFYFMDPESGQVDMSAFNEDLRHLGGIGSSQALNSEAVQWMVTLSESADDRSATAWMWMNDRLDEETLNAAPDHVHDHVSSLQEQADGSEFVSEWRSLVQAGEQGDGTAAQAVASGGASQADMARYAFDRLSDPRFTEPMHAGRVHDAVAQHGDFSASEIERISALEAQGDERGATRALMDALNIEPTPGPFGDHVRVESELHPQIIQKEAAEAGATARQYDRDSPLLGKM